MYCVNQYQIPVVLKLPLKASVHLVFFPVNWSLGKIPALFSSSYWFCILPQSSSETLDNYVHFIVCLPYSFTMNFSSFPRYLSKILAHLHKSFMWAKEQEILAVHPT